MTNLNYLFSHSFGFIGRNLGISLGGSVFGNMMKVNLHKYAPSLPAEAIVAIQNNAGAVWTSVPDDLRPGVLKAYTKTLGLVFLIGVPAAVIALIGALVMEDVKMEMGHGAPPAQGKKDVEATPGSETPVREVEVEENEREEKEVDEKKSVEEASTAVPSLNGRPSETA